MPKKAEKEIIEDIKKPLENVSIEDLDEDSRRICLHHENAITRFFSRVWRPNRTEFNSWLMKMRDDFLLIGIKYSSQQHRDNPSYKTSQRLWELAEKLSDRFEGKPAMKTEAPLDHREGGVVELPAMQKVKKSGKTKTSIQQKKGDMETSPGTSD